MTEPSMLDVPVDPEPAEEQRPPLVVSPVYVFRLLVGLTLVVLSAVALLLFEQALIGFREDVLDIQESWPEWVTITISVVIAVPIVIGILGTNVYLLYRRKFRRWIMINTAAIAAFFVGALITNGILALASEQLRDAVEEFSAGNLGNDGLASMVAVLTVGSVWIGPRLRPWVIGFITAAIAVTFLPYDLSTITVPLDVGIGLVAGSLVALILRTRDRTPTAPELVEALHQSALEVGMVRRASVDARGSVPWFARMPDGTELFVKTLNSDQRASDLMFRVYRMIRLRNAGDRRPASSLRRSVEHEAFLSLAAQSRNIRTPRLMAVSEVGSDGMLLAYERIDGTSLDELDGEEITDDLLAAIWSLVGAMQDAAIAHRDLRLANVFVADDGTPWIIDFGFAELAADESLLARDIAELMASTSAAVGPERAVAAAVSALGPDSVAEALPWIQPLALSTATRSQIGRSKGFERLRSVAAEAVGVEKVEYEKIERVKPGTILILASMAIALYVLIPQLADAAGFLDELANARWGWVAVVAAGSALTYLGAGLGMVGAVPMRLPLIPMTMAQLASSFSNRITPAKVGGMATNVRFLQKQDIPLPVAASAVGLNTVAGLLVHIGLLVLFGVIASQSVDVPLPDARTTFFIVAGIILLSGLVMVLPIGRKLVTRYLVPAMSAGATAIVKIAKTPSKLVALFAGSAIITLSYTVAMLASLAAFGVDDVSIASATVVYLAGAAVASAAPTPGGIGATEAALVAGYTAIGVDGTVAFAAVLLFRLMTFWLPILPGWIALVRLQRTGRL